MVGNNFLENRRNTIIDTKWSNIHEKEATNVVSLSLKPVWQWFLEFKSRHTHTHTLHTIRVTTSHFSFCSFSLVYFVLHDAFKHLLSASFPPPFINQKGLRIELFKRTSGRTPYNYGRSTNDFKCQLALIMTKFRQRKFSHEWSG